MKTNKEIANILIENIGHLEDFQNTGICYVLSYVMQKGIITSDEYETFDLYMEWHKPITFYRLFINNRYWFKPRKKRPRLRWLKRVK